MGLTKSLVEITHDEGYGDDLLMHINNAFRQKDMRADRIVTEEQVLAARDERIRAEVALGLSKIINKSREGIGNTNMVLVIVSNGREEKQFWTRFDPDDEDCDGRRRSVKERIGDLEHDLSLEILDGISDQESEFKLDPGYTIKETKRIKKVPEGVLEYRMY